MDAKTKMGNFLSSASGTLATLGSSWQLCHSICLTLIALLGAVGIVITGMPLLFLSEYSVYFWGFAILLLLPTLAMYSRNPKCGSKNVLMFNVGVVIAGTPGQFIGGLQPVFWLVGGIIAFAGLANWWRGRGKAGEGSGE